MNVKTILNNDLTLRQNLKLCAEAMAEYYEHKERILKNALSAINTESLSLQVQTVLEGNALVNHLVTLSTDQLQDAINNGLDTVTTTVHQGLGNVTYTQINIQDILNSYAETVESACAYGSYYRTISNSFSEGKLEVSEFINSVSTKLSSISSGVVDHLASILRASKDPIVALQTAVQSSTIPDLSDLVFNEDQYGGQNLFLSAVVSITTDITNVWNKALEGVNTIAQFCSKIGSIIGKTIGGLIEIFIPNVLQDFELHKTPVGILDVPVASFKLPVTEKNNFITQNSVLVSGYSNSKKYSGLRQTTGSQYYIDFQGINSAWEDYFQIGLTKIFDDVDSTGIVEIPLSWGVIRVFKYTDYYYIYLYPQFEGGINQFSDLSINLAIPNASNTVIHDYVCQVITNLVEDMGKFPIVSHFPTWPSSDDYNDCIYWYDGDPTILNDVKMMDLFIDRDLYNIDKCRINDLVDAIKYKDIDCTNLDMDGSSYVQTILTYCLFQMCYLYKESKGTISTGDIGIQEVYASTLSLGDDIIEFFQSDQFIPYYTYSSCPTYVHGQTDVERTAEIKTLITMVVVAAAAAAISVTAFKTKKKIRAKALYKQAQVSVKEFELGAMNPSDPGFASAMKDYRKTRRAANIWGRLANLTGDSVANTFSSVDDSSTLNSIIGILAG